MNELEKIIISQKCPSCGGRLEISDYNTIICAVRECEIGIFQGKVVDLMQEPDIYGDYYCTY